MMNILSLFIDCFSIIYLVSDKVPLCFIRKNADLSLQKQEGLEIEPAINKLTQYNKGEHILFLVHTFEQPSDISYQTFVGQSKGGRILIAENVAVRYRSPCFPYDRKFTHISNWHCFLL